MKCAVFKEPYKFEIVEREIPDTPEDQVLVKVMASGICGSDLHPYMGVGIERRKPGIIMGHEAAGVVVRTGKGVTKVKEGQRVAINPQIYCQECEQCRTGNFHLCDHTRMIGSSKNGFQDGAMCQYIHVYEKQLVMLPDEVSYDAGCMLDPLGNSMHVIRRSGLKIGDSILVMGCGTIGLGIVQLAKKAGASQVIAADISGFKLDRAKELGADVVVNTSEEDALRKIRSYTGNRGVDVGVEAAGLDATYDLTVQSVKKKGKVVALGYVGAYGNIPLSDLIFREIELIGSTGFVAECGMVMETLRQGDLQADKLVTQTFPLEQIKEAFDLLLDKDQDAIKVIIHPNDR
ncbi:zinc-dependent alcohol dehydrogenase [Diplocloster modestus]|uniref:Alcohol dehydrogenase catalytic domain-containing protein n=1 Tax=Diplocloster modestus TaxID=2850322 RepID=A0ABS6KAQ6_9FIRM|nr:alcohol dehydrogenase catalytic domain-containing protein [Diplocloster modestus]MBU9727582.1 alcohol dehydrogenase catalytic domain-containing protein [Diplocloster modestus]